MHNFFYHILNGVGLTTSVLYYSAYIYMTLRRWLKYTNLCSYVRITTSIKSITQGGVVRYKKSSKKRSESDSITVINLE